MMALKNDVADTIWRIVLMEPPEDGDPDKPYREGEVGEFHVFRSLTTSEWIVTDPHGVDHVIPDTDESLARLVSLWMQEPR